MSFTVAMEIDSAHSFIYLYCTIFFYLFFSLSFYLSLLAGLGSALFVYCHHRLVILRRKYRKYTRCLEYRYYLLHCNNVFNFTCPCTCVLYIVLSFIFFFSIFIYPAIITIIITVLSFPLGLGQFMAGEVSVSIID